MAAAGGHDDEIEVQTAVDEVKQLEQVKGVVRHESLKTPVQKTLWPQTMAHGYNLRPRKPKRLLALRWYMLPDDVL